MHNNFKSGYQDFLKDIKKRRLRKVFLLASLISFILIMITFFAIKYINIRELKSNELINKNIDHDKAPVELVSEIDNIKNPEKTDNDTYTSKLYFDFAIDSNFIIDFSNRVAAIDRVIGFKGLKIPKSKIYTYGEKVPENEVVSEDYFNDAVFIGNSQMEGVSIYSTMKNATVLAGKGIMVDTIFTKEVIKTKNSGRITIISALEQNKYGKIYIMLGANELGWAFDSEFIKQYAIVIDKIKELQPKAKIYVNGIIPVSKEKSEKDPIYNNNNIEKFNKLIINMTKEKQVYYIDSKEALGDEEGNLPAKSTTDGVHFNAEHYEKWFNYLKKHTVSDEN